MSLPLLDAGCIMCLVTHCVCGSVCGLEGLRTWCFIDRLVEIYAIVWVIVWLSAPVQSIAWKDSSAKW